MYLQQFILPLKILLSDLPFLKLIHKYILLLVLLNVLLLSVAYLLVSIAKLDLSLNYVLVLLPSFSIIAIITLIIFFSGRTKEPDNQTLYSLVSIGLKFLLEMVFALFWFLVAKKTSLQSVLMFFVLYLALTLFTISVIVKTLKSKAL